MKLHSSVVTVTFNAAQPLRSTLASRRSQTWQDFDYVVIDRGAKDGTLVKLFNELLAEFQ